MNATHRVTRFSSVISLFTQFSGNLQLDTSYRNEPYSDKGNIHRWKLERSFLRHFLVMFEFISESYTYISWSSPLTLSLRNLRTAFWIALRPTLIKEISSVQNVKEAFWETSFWSVSWSHRVTTSASRSSLLTLFSWNLQSDIWEPIGAHDDKGYILT